MCYLVIYLIISIDVNNALPSLNIYTPPLFQVELEKRQLGVGGHAIYFRVPRTLDYRTINSNLH